MPGSRIYVVNSTALIPVIQRQFRTLSFTAIESKLARDLMGVSKSTDEIISRNNTRDEGYLMTFPKYIHPAVSAGPGLDAMNRRSVEVLAESLDRWARTGPTMIKMFKWVRHELLMATTEGVYGPKNPYRDPAMEEAWQYVSISVTKSSFLLCSQILQQIRAGGHDVYFEALAQDICQGKLPSS